MASVPVAERLVAHRPLWVRSRFLSVHTLSLGLLGALSFAAARVLPLLPGAAAPGLWACPFRAATGLPCPSCGATHAFVHLAHGELAQGLFANPLFALAALGLWATAGVALLRALGLSWTLVLPAPPPSVARALRWSFAGLLLANWAFVVLVSRGGAP